MLNIGADNRSTPSADMAVCKTEWNMEKKFTWALLSLSHFVYFCSLFFFLYCSIFLSSLSNMMFAKSSVFITKYALVLCMKLY